MRTVAEAVMLSARSSSVVPEVDERRVALAQFVFVRFLFLVDQAFSLSQKKLGDEKA